LRDRFLLKEGAFPESSAFASRLAFTRYCFTSRPLWTNQSSVHRAPPCITHTVAMLLQYNCAIFEPPSTPRFYAIHHTIFCIAISRKGASWPCRRRRQRTCSNIYWHAHTRTHTPVSASSSMHMSPTRFCLIVVVCFRVNTSLDCRVNPWCTFRVSRP